jgi:DNA repair protein RecO (recombination protein O)
VLRAYELGALQAAGLMPRLARCARCGGALDGASRFPFDPASGGALCAGCASHASPAATRVEPATLAAMLRLQEGGLARAGEEPLAQAAAVEARDALSRFIEYHLGARLPSRKFLDEIGPMLSS